MDDQTDFHRVADALIGNARDLDADLAWLTRVLQARLAAYFAEPSRSPPLPARNLPPPALAAGHSPYADYVRRHDLAAEERLLALLALTPHLRPQLLDGLWTRNESTQRGFTEFGGLQAQAHGGFLPTGETAAFLLGGDDLAARFTAMRMLASGERLARLDLVHLSPVASGEPALGGALLASRRLLGLVTQGVEGEPEFGPDFPARRVTTSLEWKDLVLPQSTLDQLDEIRVWLQHGPTLLRDWGMQQRLRPNYTSLFCGPPGVGKTLCACLLGKFCGERPVYKIDLSMVVSKYIGETEKNLARVFDQAEHRGWILFFDEADALYSARTRGAGADDAHARYGNQQVSFLLQRIEEFSGVVILASNLRHNIDDAFLRRFHSVVQFPMPRAPERLRMWREAFPARTQLEARLDLVRIAERHELTGGTIVNVARHASLRALARGDTMILAEDVERGIQREMVKEGRAI